MGKIVVKPLGKAIIVILVVAGVVYGASKLFSSSDNKSGGENKNLFGTLFSSSSSDDVITLGTNTYAGFLPFMYLNNGLEPTEDCPLYKEYGLKLKIVVQDDFPAGREAFKNDNIDIIYCTADAFPVEMSEGSDMNNARFFNISNWSRGADAIVVNKSINKVSDLIGKIVCCSQGTASHTLLLNTLETNGIGSDKINMTETVLPNKVNIKIVDDGLAAAAVFRTGKCDAAVVYSPDDQELISKIGKGTHVLISTKQASNIICDGLIAKNSYLEANKEKVTKLISALLYANNLMNTDENAVKTAANAFAKAYGTDAQFAIDGSKNIYYATLGDELNFFGLNPSYAGMTGDNLYTKMARTYEELKLCKSVLPWRKVSYPDIIESLAENKQELKGDQEAEKAMTFTKTEDNVEVNTISDKSVIIEFESNSAVLDNTAQTIIDNEFADIAKEFSGAKILIVGNTDNTGNYDYNMKLSYQRAQAVADYLVKEYNFDPNKFIKKGNGPNDAIRDNVTGPNQKYRTTNFKLVQE